MLFKASCPPGSLMTSSTVEYSADKLQLRYRYHCCQPDPGLVQLDCFDMYTEYNERGDEW